MRCDEVVSKFLEFLGRLYATMDAGSAIDTEGTSINCVARKFRIMAAGNDDLRLLDASSDKRKQTRDVLISPKIAPLLPSFHTKKKKRKKNPPYHAINMGVRGLVLLPNGNETW